MVKDSLFHIANYQVIPNAGADNTRIDAMVAINQDHSIFSGHFPGNPIVPGVCLIQILLVLLTNAKQQKIFLSEVAFIKFIYPINPLINNALRYEITMKNLDSGSLLVTCNLHIETLISMKLKGIFCFQSN